MRRNEQVTERPGGNARRGPSSRAGRRRARRAARTPAQRWRRRLAGGIGAVVLLALVAGGAAWWYLNHELDAARRVTIGRGILHVSKPGAPYNILLIGSDTRKFVNNPKQAQAFGSGSVVTGQRSDVIIIARVIPAERRIYMLSIPRDTYVHIPGHVQYISGMNRINAAFNEGPGLLIETLRRDFGIPIDHFAEVNFAGFQGMVDAVGGIRIDFPYPLRDAYTGLGISHTGCQLISGGNALAFVRSRHLYYRQGGVWTPDYGSDWSRIRRQDVFFHALLDQVKQKATNLVAMNDLLGAVVHNLTVDSTMTNSMLINLALQFRHVNAGAIHTEVLPTIPDVLPSGADVLLPAKPFDNKMVASFLALGTGRHHRPRPTATSSAGSTTPTTTAPVTTTTAPSSSNVVFDNQPEPWNGTPC